MLSAGIDPVKALETLTRNNHKDKIKLLGVTRRVAKGKSLSQALHNAHLISVYQFGLLKSAESAGKLADGLDYIGVQQLKLEQAQKSMQAALWLPQAVFIIGAIVAVFIRLAKDQEPLFDIISDVGLSVLSVLALTRIAVLLWSREPQFWLSLFWSTRFVRERSDWFKLRFEVAFYRPLQWQLSAGVVMDQALRNLSPLLTDKRYKQQLVQATKAVLNGQSTVKALLENRLVLSSHLRAVLRTGEQSGTFEEALGHQLKLMELQIAEQVQQQIRWWPKLYYSIVLLLVLSMV